jgi:hypothetical protein
MGLDDPPREHFVDALSNLGNVWQENDPWWDDRRVSRELDR